MLLSVAKGFWNPAKVLPVYYIYTATGRIITKVFPKATALETAHDSNTNVLLDLMAYRGLIAQP